MIDTLSLDALVEAWLAVDPNVQSRAEIQSLHAAKDYATLGAKMAPRIAFGTAGLRSSMESGFAHMNDVTVLQASQGLVAYLTQGSAPSPLSLVIGHDHRHHSRRFAEITASVALASGFHVYYLGSRNLSTESSASPSTRTLPAEVAEMDGLCHTPLVPFGIDHYGASGGVMVTASHNPANDNGFKVYYGNGCQIIPPHDEGIASSIEANLMPWHEKGVWDVARNFERGLATGQLVLVKEELSQVYVDAIKTRLAPDLHTSFQFVYTPMHGVGEEMFSRMCREFGISYHSVEQQRAPDPDFPTVKFPNPEETGALDLAVKTAKDIGARLVLANDPDADRFAVVVCTNQDQWRPLSGNEVGALFATYIIEELTPKDQLADTYLVNSTVSSQLMGTIAAQNGCHYVDTLTGFKWIGNKAIDLRKKGMHVPFAYEEAIGYMFPIVNDKDGIAAAVVWMRLYEAWFAKSGIDPFQKLEQIYARYGWYKECNGYYKPRDLTAYIFDHTIRGSYDKFPLHIGAFKVVQWRDLTLGYDSSTPDNKPLLPVDPKSQMITGTLEKDGVKVRFTCRGSGTEPKLKVYVEATSANGGDEASKLARECWDTLRDEWFDPEED